MLITSVYSEPSHWWHRQKQYAAYSSGFDSEGKRMQISCRTRISLHCCCGQLAWTYTNNWSHTNSWHYAFNKMLSILTKTLSFVNFLSSFAHQHTWVCKQPVSPFCYFDKWDLKCVRSCLLFKKSLNKKYFDPKNMSLLQKYWTMSRDFRASVYCDLFDTAGPL